MMPNNHSGKPALLAVDDALAAIIAMLTPTATNVLPLADALGYTLAVDLVARLTLPPQAVSAMDGYAVRGEDVRSLPCQLTRIAESAAGHPWSGKINVGQAVRVFTGAAIPDGADTIVIQEDVDPIAEKDGVVITVRNAEPPGRYIRPAGLDIEKGQVILCAGTLLSARGIGLATAAGLTEAVVSLPPRIGVLSTGDELVQPGTIPGPGQIISSNASFLRSFLASCGAETVDLGIARDVPGAMVSAVRKYENLDLIVTTGGASVGTHDFIVSDLDGSTCSGLNFWKIAMRPGKPLICGHVDGIPLIGLPGNPVSTAVCALVFLRPAIAYMARDNRSVTSSIDPTFMVPLGVDLNENDHRQDYIRANLEDSDNGQIIQPAPRQDSSMMSTLTMANALIVRPPHDPAKRTGDMVKVIHIPAIL
jgi:molybdopterin molybdotransferase